MNLTDDDRAIVLGVMDYAGPDMDPDDQAFYLRHHIVCEDIDGTPLIEDAPTWDDLEADGLVEFNEDEIPVLTAAAIEAAQP